MNNPLLHPSIVEMLKNLEEVLSKFGIDFYLVGAVARDIQLSANLEAAAARKTNDIDIAIMLNDAGQFNTLKNALVGTGNFTAHPKESIKFFYNEAIELDLLPFGEIENINRKVRLEPPNLFVLNMPGLKEIYPYVQNIELENGLNIKVCSLEGIVLLKLISNNDRPQRDKDITDIEHIIGVYFELHHGDIYESNFDLMELYPVADRDYLQLVCAHVIGRKMFGLLAGSDELKQRIESILEKRPTTWWQAMLAGLRD